MSIKVTGKDLPCTDVLEVVTKLLQQQIEIVQEATKGSHKTAKVNRGVTQALCHFFLFFKALKCFVDVMVFTS